MQVPALSVNKDLPVCAQWTGYGEINKLLSFLCLKKLLWFVISKNMPLLFFSPIEICFGFVRDLAAGENIHQPQSFVQVRISSQTEFQILLHSVKGFEFLAFYQFYHAI